MANEDRHHAQDLATRLDQLAMTDSLDEASLSSLRALCEEAISYAETHKDADSWHLAALAWYELPECSTRRSKMIRFCEAQALEIDPTHQFARQYLAYQQFDEGFYEDALKSLELLTPEYFEELGQHWRVLKNRELVLAARLHLQLDVSLDDIQSLLKDYVSASDVDDDAVPLELANALVASVEAGETVDSRVLEQFRLTVNQLGFHDALHQQLDRLGRAAI